MKRILVYAFLLIFVTLAKRTSAQGVTFWYETFGIGCNQGQVAPGPVYTATNGPWTGSNTGPNGVAANEWYVSATEAGRPPGTCGNGCLNNAGLTNRSLHIGSSVAGPGFDVGAFYLQAATAVTDKQVISPIINCTGQNAINFSFTYLANGVPGVDFGEVAYSIMNGPFIVLGPIAPSVGGCAPNGLWALQTYALPPTCDGVTNLRVAFRWQNNNAVGPGNISVAVDEITLASPKLTFTVPALGCPNVCFTANVVAPFITPAPSSYSWSSNPPFSSITNSTSASPCIAVPAIGIYTITGYAMAPGSVITASTTQTISIVSQIPFTLTSSPATICLGETATLTAFGGVTYTWGPSPITFPSNGAQVVAIPNGPSCYSVTGNDISGCPGAGVICIALGGAPVINVAVTSSAVCNGFTSTLTASGANTYTWTGTSLPVAIFQPSVSVGPGTYTVCASSVGLPCNTCSVIVIATAPPLTILPSQSSPTTCVAYNFPVKVSKPVVLSCQGASIYDWIPTSSLNYSIGPSVIARPPSSVCYTVTGKTTVCSGSAIVCVTVIPQYTVDVIPKQPILCYGDSIKLRIANFGSVSIAPFTYNWIEPGNAPPPSIDDPLNGTITISPTNTNASITYSAEAFDARACASDPRLITVTVIPQPITSIAIPTIITGGGLAVQSNSVCYVGNSSGSNPEAVITLTANNGNGLPPQYSPTFTWTSPYSTTYSSMAILNTPNDFTVVLAAPLRTPGVVVYTIQSGFNGILGCKRFDTVSLRVIDCRSVTVVSFTTALENDTICSRTCVAFLNLTDTAAGGQQIYNWTFPGGAPNTSTLANPVICYNLPGKHNVVLKVSNPWPRSVGSSLTKGVQRFIKVVDIPNPKILPRVMSNHDTIIRFGASVALTATNATRYVWSPNHSISSITGSMVTVNPFRNQQYVLTGYNSSACWSRDTINVIVIEDCGEMFVPNAFSPNGDGFNDELKVRGLCLESMTFMVFNRWGEKIFETTDQEIGWDGTFKGELLNTGVFAFRLEGKTHEGKGYSLKGNVTLIR